MILRKIRCQKVRLFRLSLKVKVFLSCPTLCNSMDYTVHGTLQARILEWVSCSLLPGILPMQGSNTGLLHCRQILYHLSHWGSSRILGGQHSAGDLPDPGIKPGLLHYRQILYQLSSQGNPRETEGPTALEQFLKALQLLLRCTIFVTILRVLNTQEIS